MLAANSSGAGVVLAKSALRAWLPRACLVAPRVVASRDGFPFFCLGLVWLDLACLGEECDERHHSPDRGMRAGGVALIQFLAP